MIGVFCCSKQTAGAQWTFLTFLCCDFRDPRKLKLVHNELVRCAAISHSGRCVPVGGAVGRLMVFWHPKGWGFPLKMFIGMFFQIGSLSHLLYMVMVLFQGICKKSVQFMEIQVGYNQIQPKSWQEMNPRSCQRLCFAPKK